MSRLGYRGSAFQIGVSARESGHAQILEGLLTAALETLRDYPAILAEDERARILLHVLAEGLYEDSRALLAAPGQTLTEKERIRAWPRMVFGSVVKSVGTTVFAEPEKFLGISGATEGELVSGVGRAVLTSLMVGDSLNLNVLLTCDRYWPERSRNRRQGSRRKRQRPDRVCASGGARIKEVPRLLPLFGGWSQVLFLSLTESSEA